LYHEIANAFQGGKTQMTNNCSAKLLLTALLVAVCFYGCQKKATDDDAIRAAINKHLLAIGTLNLQAMEMDVTQVAVQDDRATAQVTFRPKTGAPAGAAMQVAYQLEKREGNWNVMKSAAAGGMIEHPAPGTNPHGPAQGAVHSSLPNFQEMLGSPNPDATTTLPPGHPPVAQSSQPQSSQPQTSQPQSSQPQRPQP
jgi:hypothetical protein